MLILASIWPPKSAQIFGFFLIFSMFFCKVGPRWPQEGPWCFWGFGPLGWHPNGPNPPKHQNRKKNNMIGRRNHYGHVAPYVLVVDIDVRPKAASRERPRAPQKSPRAPQECPRAPQECPRVPQERPRPSREHKNMPKHAKKYKTQQKHAKLRRNA